MAGLFILLWTYVALLAAQFQAPRLFGIAIFIIGARLFGMYLEVFGTLLETGFGLIISGVFLLLLVGLWHKKRQILWHWLGGEHG